MSDNTNKDEYGHLISNNLDYRFTGKNDVREVYDHNKKIVTWLRLLQNIMRASAKVGDNIKKREKTGNKKKGLNYHITYQDRDFARFLGEEEFEYKNKKGKVVKDVKTHNIKYSMSVLRDMNFINCKNYPIETVGKDQDGKEYKGTRRYLTLNIKVIARIFRIFKYNIDRAIDLEQYGISSVDIRIKRLIQCRILDYIDDVTDKDPSSPEELERRACISKQIEDDRLIHTVEIVDDDTGEVTYEENHIIDKEAFYNSNKKKQKADINQTSKYNTKRKVVRTNDYAEEFLAEL